MTGNGVVIVGNAEPILRAMGKWITHAGEVAPFGQFESASNFLATARTDVLVTDFDGYRDREIDGERGLDRDHDAGPPDPRDVFLHDVDLPRGSERETVLGRDRAYEINGDESRTLATVGALRIVPEKDLREPRDESLDRPDDHLRHLPR